jgi:predicted DCC family thiol-disulfide oxidoreductase YuxK
MERAVLLFDSDCGFCRWSVDKVMRWDRGHRIRLVALQDPEADAFLGDMPEAERMGSWHLVADGGRVYSGGAVAAPLLRLLPGGRRLARVFAAFPGTTERSYRWAARNRDRLGRLTRQAAAQCRVRFDRYRR